MAWFRRSSARARARAAMLAARETQSRAGLGVQGALAAFRQAGEAASAQPGARTSGREHQGTGPGVRMAAADAGQAGREGGAAPARAPQGAEPRQQAEASGIGLGEQEARQQWLSGGAARDEDEELWFEQFGDEEGSDRSAGELDFIAEHYRTEREKRAAPDRGVQLPGREAQLAAAARLSEAVARAVQAHGAYAAAQDAERAAPDGPAGQADAQAARLAAGEAQFYADLEVSDAREKFLWLQRAYSAPPTWLAEPPTGGRDPQDAPPAGKGQALAEPATASRGADSRPAAADPTVPERTGRAPAAPQRYAQGFPSRRRPGASLPGQFAASGREPATPSRPGSQSGYAAEDLRRPGQANPEADLEAGS